MDGNAHIPTPNFDRIDPRTCVNGKLRRLHRLINSAYMAQLKPFGLRGSMLSILFIIGKRRKVHQKTLAELLVLDQSTMSRDLKKLVDKGWVRKHKGSDQRFSELELTNEGYALLEEVVPVWEKMHHQMQDILGTYNLQQIDVITSAIQSSLVELNS